MLAVPMQRTVSAFQECKYNFLTVNCHAFVAHFLNELQYGGRKNWNMVHLVSVLQLHSTALTTSCQLHEADDEQSALLLLAHFNSTRWFQAVSCPCRQP